VHNAVATVEAVLSVLEAGVMADVWDAVVPIAVVTADVAVIVSAIMSSVLNRIR
jgi:hypothetical protein